ncbi:RICIN domain-containing protein [Wenjunlia tyrosinilytica]|uniref:Ricin B lectin domain-containing protein n=1 Tax=Wenjunlia tyrosinilytica TaxID=1544741 RepID=A0A917ZRW6_9ACTN|nr:RICIN domain-containing protein [Wenjunlia tyrosinilytica]GGO91723.1 hypothetical protein GCM10012280_40260 [Wenjunlia tyrosinilytica]
MKKVYVAASLSCLAVLFGATLMPSANAGDSAHKVTIHSAAADAVLDSEAVAESFFRLKQEAPAGTASQQWVLTDVGDGWSQIRNAKNGYCLDGTGNYVLLAKCASAADASQRWKTLPAEGGTVMLTSADAAHNAVLRGDKAVPGFVGYLSEPQGGDAVFRWKIEDAKS